MRWTMEWVHPRITTSWVVHLVHWRERIPSEGLAGLRGGGHVNSMNMKFTKSKCKVLHLSWSQYQYRMGDGQIESRPVEKDWSDWWMKSWTWASSLCSQPDSQLHPGLHKLKESINLLSFSLYMRWKLFDVRVGRHWNRFPREIVDVPPLRDFKVRLDRTLSNLI